MREESIIIRIDNRARPSEAALFASAIPWQAGTRMHRILERTLKKAPLISSDNPVFDFEWMARPFSRQEKMIVETILTKVLSILYDEQARDQHPLLRAEMPVACSKWNPDICDGVADCVIFCDHYLYIFEFKTGARSVDDPAQLEAYANTLLQDTSCDTVIAEMIQPLCYEDFRWTIRRGNGPKGVRENGFKRALYNRSR